MVDAVVSVHIVLWETTEYITGFIALHSAIIWRNEDAVELLLDAERDTTIETRCCRSEHETAIPRAIKISSSCSSMRKNPGRKEEHTEQR